MGARAACAPPWGHIGGGAAAVAVLGALIVACGSSLPRSGVGDAGGTSVIGDAGHPAISVAERAALAALALPSFPPPPADVSNKFADDPNAALLGRRLFFEPGFSGKLLDGDNDGSVHALGNVGDTGKVACAGCHLPSGFFSDTRSLSGEISLGAGWGIRRAPSLLDVSRSKLIMWDGRRDALYNQVFGPTESATEMNAGRLFVAERLFALYRSDYEALFGAMPPLDDPTRFPQLTAANVGCSKLGSSNTCVGTQHGAPGDGAEYDKLAAADQDAVTRVVVNMGKAIGAYERLLTSGTSRFDTWMSGDKTALGASEQRGALLFVGKGKCATCHSGPFLSDEHFHDVGLRPIVVATVFLDANDDGAFTGVAKAIADPLNVRGVYSDGDDGRTPATVPTNFAGAFRTPRLRCVSKRPSFMHTGQLRTLADVVAFFNGGGDAVGYLGTNELAPLNLTASEQADLVAFLGALDGPGPGAELLAAPK